MSSSASRRGKGKSDNGKGKDWFKAVLIFAITLTVLLFLNSQDWFGIFG